MSHLPLHPYGMQQLQMQMQMQAQAAQAMHAAHQQMQQQQQQMHYYPPQSQGSPDDRPLDAHSTSSQIAMLEAQHAALQAQYTAEAQMQQAMQQQAQMRHQQHMQAAAASGSPVEYAGAPGSESAAKPRRAPRPAPSSGAARAGSEVSAGQGPGTSLGEILVLAKRFEKVSNDDPRTKLLYTVCFPYFSGTIPERTAKKSLRLFNGWGTAEMRAAARIRLAEHAGDADLLRKLARLLDLSHEGTADELCARLEDWLASPSAVVHAPKDEVVGADGKKKRKASEKKDKGLKRPPNPYLLFANEKREEVVRSKPDLLMMEVNRILGQLWASVSDADRAPYIESAARLREVWDREHPDQAGKNAASAAAGGSGSGRKRRATNGAGADAAMDGAESDLSDGAAAAAGGGRARSGSRFASSPSPVSSALSNQLALQLQAAIVRIVHSTELERLSLRLVKQHLAAQFSETLVQHNAQIISDLVDQELIKM